MCLSSQISYYCFIFCNVLLLLITFTILYAIRSQQLKAQYKLNQSKFNFLLHLHYICHCVVKTNLSLCISLFTWIIMHIFFSLNRKRPRTHTIFYKTIQIRNQSAGKSHINWCKQIQYLLFGWVNSWIEKISRKAPQK